MNKFVFAAVMFSSSFAISSTYRCTTEFGELIPLRAHTLKSGQSCADCSDPQAKIPAAKIDRRLTREWPHPANDPAMANTKRKVLTNEGRTIYFDTSYRKHEGPSFEMQLDCEKENSCHGNLKSASAPLTLTARPADLRHKKAEGHAEVSFTRRDYFGILVRVFKKAGTQAWSASGEMKFFREDPMFSLDAGADEQLAITPGFTVRIPALEIKVICTKAP